MNGFKSVIFCLNLVFFIAPANAVENDGPCFNALKEAREARLGRLTEFYNRLQDEEDVIFLDLVFEDNQPLFEKTYKELKNQGANFVSQDFISWSYFTNEPIRRMFGYAKSGQGTIRLMLTKKEILRFQSLLDRAEKVESFRAGTSDENGVIRAKRTFEEKLNRHHLAKWQEVSVAGFGEIILVSSVDREHYKEFMRRFKVNYDWQIERVFFNPAQSLVYITIYGPTDMLKEIVERHSYIQEVQITDQKKTQE